MSWRAAVDQVRAKGHLLYIMRHLYSLYGTLLLYTTSSLPSTISEVSRTDFDGN